MYAQQVQPANPLATMSQYAGLQGQMQQNQLMQRTMAARQATGEAVQGATDADGNYDPRAAMAAAAQDPRAAFGAAEFQGFNQGQQAEQQKLQQAKLEQAITVRGTINQSLGALMSKPDSITPGAVTSQIGELVAGNILPAAEAAKQIADMPTDPQQLKSWVVNHWMQGQAMSTQLQAMMPPAMQVDDGKNINFVRNPAIGATPGPIAKQTTPEFDSSRVAGPVGPDGEQTSITQGQSKGMGTYATSKGPAYAAAATTSGAGTAQDAIAFENAARAAPGLKASLANMSGDVKQLDTGPGSAKRGGFLAAVNSFMGTNYNAERVAAQEGLDKVHADVAARLRQAGGLPSTDQSSSIMDHAVPGSQLSKLGNANQIAILKGGVDYAQAANKAWESYKSNGHGSETFHQFTTALNQRLDPVVFQMQYMSDTQRSGLVGAMNAQERAHLAQSVAFARHNKLIP